MKWDRVEEKFFGESLNLRFGGFPFPRWLRNFFQHDLVFCEVKIAFIRIGFPAFHAFCSETLEWISAAAGILRYYSLAYLFQVLLTQNILPLKIVFKFIVRLNYFSQLLLMIESLKRFMVVLGVLHNQMLLAVLVGGHDASFALVEAGPCARPVHLVARDFVFGKWEIANFKFSGAPESCDEPHEVCWERERKCG